jgi:preprotein translocase subunit SecD
MPRSWWYRTIFMLLAMVFGILHVIPTMFPNLDAKKLPVKHRINLGLDLQGGLYLVLGVEFPTVYRESLIRNAKTLESDMKKRGVGIKSVNLIETSAPTDPLVDVQIEDPAKAEEFRSKLKSDWGSIFRIERQSGTGFSLGFTSEHLLYVNEKTISQSIEVIRNRIDEFGVSEPVITSHGKDRILIELPGVQDVERAKSLIGQTAKLEFKIVQDHSLSQSALQGLIDKIIAANKEKFPEDQKLSEYVRLLNSLGATQLPEGTEIAFERIKDPVTNNIVGKTPYLLSKQVDVTGEDLQDAFVSVDQQDNMPFVSLNFNYRGAEKFEKVTGENVRKRLAIVLDGVVHSAPVLQEKIGGGKARITMGRGNYEATLKESTDLAIVLRAGALPAQLQFQEERVVGPSLGADSIRDGKVASWISFGLIFFFMVLIYRVSGLIANFALALNGLLILAILVGLEATLTLPGIAGIALTLGMAVDANIIIYERIREELRSGKSVMAAVDMGFSRASSTIIDANVTTAIAALVLMEFGTGPVRGFAVTLLVGLATSMFTAVFISKIFFDLWLQTSDRARKALSI